jgi:hypothetical protein
VEDDVEAVELARLGEVACELARRGLREDRTRLRVVVLRRGRGLRRLRRGAVVALRGRRGG